MKTECNANVQRRPCCNKDPMNAFFTVTRQKSNERQNVDRKILSETNNTKIEKNRKEFGEMK